MKRAAAMIATAVAIPVLATSVYAVAPTDSTAPVMAAGSAPVESLAAETDFAQAAAWAERDATRQVRRATRDSDGVRSYGTQFTARQAAARLKRWAHQSVGGYADQCLRLADDAYGAKGPRTATAMSQWVRARDAGLAQSEGSDIPVGAQMFWRTSNPAGHIATYVGGGKVVTNMPGGSVEIVEWRTLNEWGPYLGWAPPYYR